MDHFVNLFNIFHVLHLIFVAVVLNIVIIVMTKIIPVCGINPNIKCTKTKNVLNIQNT